MAFAQVYDKLFIQGMEVKIFGIQLKTIFKPPPSSPSSSSLAPSCEVNFFRRVNFCMSLLFFDPSFQPTHSPTHTHNIQNVEVADWSKSGAETKRTNQRAPRKAIFSHAFDRSASFAWIQPHPAFSCSTSLSHSIVFGSDPFYSVRLFDPSVFVLSLSFFVSVCQLRILLLKITMLRLLVAVTLLACAVVQAEIYFQEDFDSPKWSERWIQSEFPGKEYGTFEWTAGKFYGDDLKDKGLRTSQDARFYGISSKFEDKKFSNEGKDLVIQFSGMSCCATLGLCVSVLSWHWTLTTLCVLSYLLGCSQDMSRAELHLKLSTCFWVVFRFSFEVVISWNEFERQFRLAALLILNQINLHQSLIRG